MPGWLIVVLLLVAFLAWAGWVLNKRSPSPHGEDRPKRDLGGMGGGG